MLSPEFGNFSENSTISLVLEKLLPLSIKKNADFSKIIVIFKKKFADFSKRNAEFEVSQVPLPHKNESDVK